MRKGTLHRLLLQAIELLRIRGLQGVRSRCPGDVHIWPGNISSTLEGARAPNQLELAIAEVFE